MKTAAQIVTHLRQFQWSDNKGSSFPKRELRMYCKDLQNDARRGTRSLNPLSRQMLTETIQMSRCSKTTWDKRQLQWILFSLGHMFLLSAFCMVTPETCVRNSPFYRIFFFSYGKIDRHEVVFTFSAWRMLWHQGEPALIVIDLTRLR